MLAVIETHPIQYHAPIYRALEGQFGVPVTAVYGSDFSVAGYRDAEFGVTLAWDTDLLSGYSSIFLSRVGSGGAREVHKVATRGLGDALRKAGPRAVLLTGYSPRFHQTAFYQAWRSRRPILFRGETTSRVDRSAMKALLWKYGLRWLYGHCARLLYIGQRSYQHFRYVGCPEEKLVFSPYCVDTSAFQCDEASRERLRPAVRRDLGIGETQTVLLFSGKLYRAKGPELLLLALKELPSRVLENVVVLFLGSGELKDPLEELARSRPPVKAQFLGFQNQTRLSRYYHAADMLVLPSYSETWGLVVNEALHHGLPCLVSQNVGCAPDLICPEATGEVCETRSVSSLASAIQRMRPLVGRREIREKCRERVSGYSVEKAAEGIARAYAAALQESRR